MRAGKMDRRVTLLKWQETGRDALNAPIEDWVPAGPPVWAQQRPERGAERFSAAQIAGAKVMTFHIRFRSDISIKDRLSYKGQVFEISDVRELGRQVVSEIDCVAVQE